MGRAGWRGAPPDSPFSASPIHSYRPPPGSTPLACPGGTTPLPSTSTSSTDPLWLLQLPPGWDTSAPLTLAPPPPGAPPAELGRGVAPDGTPIALIADHESAVAGAWAWVGGGGAPERVTRRATLVRLGPRPVVKVEKRKRDKKEKKKKDREGKKDKKKKKRRVEA